LISEDEIRYYSQLDERQQRVFLGLKAKSLGSSGVRVVSEAFGVDPKTVRKGKQDLSVLPDEPPRRVRQAGGGAKKTRTAPRVAGRPSTACWRAAQRAFRRTRG